MSINTNGIKELLDPKVVAVIGASDKYNEEPNKEYPEGTPAVPRSMFTNLLAGAKESGRVIIPVNPKRAEETDAEKKKVVGVTCVKDVASIDGTVDVVVSLLPPNAFPSILEMIEQCHQKGVKDIIMPASGFSETGPAGILQERQIVEALKGKIRLIGTNCLGVFNPHANFNATFLAQPAEAGGAVLISQSGAMAASVACDAVAGSWGLLWGVSVGSGADVQPADLMAYASEDPRTKVVMLYLEGIKNPRDFLEAAKMLRDKNIPVYAVKAGRTEIGGKAASSHTGALIVEDDVFDAILRRAGIVRIDIRTTVVDFSNVGLMANKLRIIPGHYDLLQLSHAGGTGVLEADTNCDIGATLATLSEATKKEVTLALPKLNWSNGNPLDMTGGASPKNYGDVMKIALLAPEVHILHVIVQSLGVVRPTSVAKAIIEAHKNYANGKPVVVSLMANMDDWTKNDNEMKKSREMFREADIPCTIDAESAARAINYLVRREKLISVLNNAGEKPKQKIGDFFRTLARRDINDTREEGRFVLTTVEALNLFEDYGIPVVKTIVAETAKEAVLSAKEIGYPVVLKLHSKTEKGSHKTDVDGVELNLKSDKAVASAFNRIRESVTEKIGAEYFQGVIVQPMADAGTEVLFGILSNSTVGKTLAFGWGGTDVEYIKDKVVTLTGLTPALALWEMEKTKIYQKLIHPRKGKPINVESVIDVFIAISQIAEDFPEIKELDINPLIANENGVLVVDGRVKLHKIGEERESAIE